MPVSYFAVCLEPDSTFSVTLVTYEKNQRSEKKVREGLPSLHDAEAWLAAYKGDPNDEP